MSSLARLRAGRLAGTQRLKLSCGLTEFPREIFDLADTLEVLDLSGNALESLPDDLGQLHRLRILFCSDNLFARVPESVGQCRALEIVGFKANRIRQVPAASLPPLLRWLILTDNEIETLPATIGGRPRLQKLMLAGNRLRSLPLELADCGALELIRISANRFDALPDWLPAMPRLAWLAFGGNPLSEAREAELLHASSTPAIEWREIALQHRLGEGASGVIHQAQWRGADGNARPVAVKLFKGAVTSDGWPRSEMAACIGAGLHPHLIALRGQLTGHPDGITGLVLDLVDAEFDNLAGPPSLQSCTRDVYADDAGWTALAAMRLARDVASAVAQLHARGVLHGDLYAHNILLNRRGACLLGDFGAASLLPRDDASRARALQRVEARAFGCLVEELLDRSRITGEADPAAITTLQKLRSACLDTDPTLRPTFAELAALLDSAAG